MSLATLEGIDVTRATLQIPAWGLWWADLDLAEEITLSGSATLTIAGVTLTGTVASGGPAEGRSSYRLVAGAGGWGREIPRKGYADDLGVKVATVIGDAAAAVGESLAAVPTTRLGPHFARDAGPAYRVLHEVAPRAWHVDFYGVTRFGLRASSTYEGDASRVRRDKRTGVVELAVNDDADFSALVPGVTVDDLAPAVDVEWELDSARLTARIYGGVTAPRRLLAWSRLLDALDPRRGYRGLYEYRVVTLTGNRLNLQPARVSSGKPDLARVPMRPGLAGTRAPAALGSLVLVAFADSDPSRPCVVAFDAPDSPGWATSEIVLGGTSKPLALAADVEARFGEIKTFINSHTHPDPTSGSTGTPTPPTLWMLPGQPATVASGKVKTDG